ncbi:MAG: hypothetical protein E7220_03740 [Clostridiales bacterium]|nr:hypothetical protein [Clostridiales bacterium]
MKYKINKTNYCDFNTIRVNRMEARSYFISYPDRKSADAVSLKDKRYGSPRVRCLNGEWDFRFYPRPAELPDVIDTDSLDFDRIDVPACWQFRGYDRPFYVNARYPFPYDPPHIPEEKKTGRTFCWVGADCGLGPKWLDPGEDYNFVGVYRTFFDISQAEMQGHCVLSFLGVASCADVYINGEFVGYAEGSHNTAEYDITSHLTAGENELVAVVHRWCNGSYLECQDMFRNNGIFRDVLLRIYNRNDIRDIDLRTAKGPDGKYSASVSADLFGEGEVTFTLSGHGIEVSETVMSSAGKAEASFDDLDVTEWNAEDPVLYDLYIEMEGTCVKVRCGFRDVTIKGDLFLLNGRRLKLHGVNHHDTSCTNGYYMTPEEIERDMRLCKEYNIDTVRTSHYPPDPYLLEVCDELGIYVVDEADIETHGTYTQTIPGDYNRISHDPAWESHYTDRGEQLYQRDKLHPSIIMWSLGNEAGGWCNQDKMYEYIKARSPLPIHYESAIHSRKKAYDVGSEMYPPVARVHEIGEKTYEVKELCDRPYFLCEYAHAMGVGPGDMEAYWKEIYAYDSMMGGCVWEMVDHAVLHEDGSYTYGGDHGEWIHDGNFCVDGMFYPDRSPSTGAKIAAFIYRPIRVSHLGGDTFEVFNTKAFTEGSAYVLRLQWSDGTEQTVVPGAGPLERVTLELPVSEHIEASRKAGTDCLLTVITEDAGTGRELAREQIIIEEHFMKAADISAGIGSSAGDTRGGRPEVVPQTCAPVPVKENGRPGLLFGDTGMRWAEPYTILFRAPTDNDAIMFGLKDSMKPFYAHHREVITIRETDGAISVRDRIVCHLNAFTGNDTYKMTPEGVLVTCRLSAVPGIGELPRFGKAFRLDESFDTVEYYGRNGESYADMKDQAQIAHVTCKVEDMTEPNIRPQESGNRCDCRSASVSNGRYRITFTAVDKAFELGIKPYSDIELIGMKHREDEVRTGTYVTISAFQKGIGTGICGPQTAPEYCYPANNEYTLSFLITIEEIK